jgi:glycosyltransferase involved in cell wall biosynthesis
MAMGFGIKSHVVRYYQAATQAADTAKSGMHGFFWLRREEQISWATVRKLIAGTHFDSFHIHLASDPGSPEPRLPSAADFEKYNITTSTWFENKSDFNAVLERANVFFASRMEEGIGQSFLEALERGQCVVAPNSGTMNEYIIHGVNGLLYDGQLPQSLDFKEYEKLGRRGQEGARRGRDLWEKSEADIVKFILSPSDVQYIGKYEHKFSNLIQRKLTTDSIVIEEKKPSMIQKCWLIWCVCKKFPPLRFLK